MMGPLEALTTCIQSTMMVRLMIVSSVHRDSMFVTFFANPTDQQRHTEDAGVRLRDSRDLV